MALHSYTVHHPSADSQAILAQTDRLVFVKEGFSWPAFFVPFLWLLYHRMWLVLVLFIAASIVIGIVPEIIPLTPAMQAALGLGVNLIMGLQGNDLLRWTLARRGRKEIAVVVGNGIAGAEHRFFERLCSDGLHNPNDFAPSAPATREPVAPPLQAAFRARQDYSILPEPGRL